MTRSSWYSRHPWSCYSKKLSLALSSPQYGGSFHIQKEGFRQVHAQRGSLAKGYLFCLHGIIDEGDGVITDLRYQLFGPSALIALLEASLEWMMRKTYRQAERIDFEALDREVRDRGKQKAFPEEALLFFSPLLQAVQEIAKQCLDIPTTYSSSPLPSLDTGEGPLKNWESLSNEEKLLFIENVFQEKIKPYIALDEGDVQIVGLSKEDQLTIAYQGNCTSCYSAIGSTLTAIQQILQKDLSPTLTVIPDPSSLNLLLTRS